MKRFLSAVLALLTVLTLVSGMPGLAAEPVVFDAVNEAAAGYLAASGAYDLAAPVSVVKDYSEPETPYQKDQPAGYPVPAADGGTVEITDGTRIWTEPTAGDTYTICNLVPGVTCHYVTTDPAGAVVSEGDVTAAGALRMIRLDGAVRNVRDLGGWAADGGTVRYGLIYRGAKLDDINERDRRLFRDWLGVQTEIDLRRPDEIDLDGGSALGADREYVHIDMRSDAFDTTEVNLARYNALLNTVMDRAIAGTASFFHCAIGCDRTGHAGFLLLGLLGVDALDLARDYELSTFSPHDRLWTGSAFQNMLSQMNELPGDTLQERCAAFARLAGISDEKLEAYRAAMIEPPAPSEPTAPTEPTVPALPFLDVPEGAYYHDAVLWAANCEPRIANGVDAAHFLPDAPCTRGQIVTFLWRAKGCPEPVGTAAPFADVKDGAYCSTAVRWAVEAGVTNGVSKTAFAPDAPCTRAQAVTLLHRAAGEPPAGQDSPFADVPAGRYYTAAVCWAVSKEITNGTGAGRFTPDAPCARGQIVTLLWRSMR